MTTATRLGMFSLLGAASSIHDFVESRLSTVGLSVPRLAALQRLVDAGGSLPLGQLAERLACVKSNVTQLVDRLEADGLVTREADQNDRRSRLAVLTEAGRKAYARGTEIHQRAERELFSALTPEEAAQLHELLAKLERSRRA